MKNNLINILTNSPKEIDTQVLMDYVNGKLSHAEQHEVEEWLEENQFAADALEGIQKFGNKDQLNEYVSQLNLELKAYLLKKKHRRQQKQWKDLPWTYMAILLMLCLALITYIVLRMLGPIST